jgi:hypothetical protein
MSTEKTMNKWEEIVEKLNKRAHEELQKLEGTGVEVSYNGAYNLGHSGHKNKSTIDVKGWSGRSMDYSYKRVFVGDCGSELLIQEVEAKVWGKCEEMAKSMNEAAVASQQTEGRKLSKKLEFERKFSSEGNVCKAEEDWKKTGYWNLYFNNVTITVDSLYEVHAVEFHFGAKVTLTPEFIKTITEMVKK